MPNDERCVRGSRKPRSDISTIWRTSHVRDEGYNHKHHKQRKHDRERINLRPRCESGQVVQLNVTLDPAVAGA